MIDIGYFALCLALAASGYAVFASVLGARRNDAGLIRSGENSALVLCGLLTVAVAVLWHAIFTHDFQVEFVASNSNRAMPTLFIVSSLWGGQSGSILFWSWLLSVFGMAVVVVNRHRYRTLMPYVVATMAGTNLFFVVLNLFESDPFVKLPFTPADGTGLNPLLQHPLMAIHPPLLYLGMVGLSVPFAFAIAALLSKQLDVVWLRASRRWLLMPWALLGFGLLLGGKWAYVELGWGGYWGWDPVENSSLMPWLAGTALIHSVMIQERKGMLKIWNMILVFLTYGLTIFGTFITRSGLVTSVHSFAKSDIGLYFVAFLAILGVLSFGLLASRWSLLETENKLESVASRESAFLLNNWILIGMLFAVFWGTLFPVVSEALTGERISVTAPFFNQVNTPIAMVLLFLTGAGPLFAWRRTSTESLKKNFLMPLSVTGVTAVALVAGGVRDLYAVICLSLCAFVVAAISLEFHRGTVARQRNAGESYVQGIFGLLIKSRRRYGGYLVHLSMIMLFVGFAGKAFTTEHEFVLGYGESEQVGDYTVRFESLAHREDANVAVSA
ncbi:MAG: heme lyase CcmF/NrfE family subunit, partial [Verrucomicrobia bacterium]|nr:heme lyase CcmF/NrfE family subunit [Verrucomicrobiota bacterium]